MCCTENLTAPKMADTQETVGRKLVEIFERGQHAGLVTEVARNTGCLRYPREVRYGCPLNCRGVDPYTVREFMCQKLTRISTSNTASRHRVVVWQRSHDAVSIRGEVAYPAPPAMMKKTILTKE